MALEPQHGMSVILADTRLANLRDLLVQAYNASESPNELLLVRMLGQAYFGVDMLHEALPDVWPRTIRVKLPRDFKVVDRYPLRLMQ